MKNVEEVDDERRLWLVQALAAGLLGSAGSLAQAEGFSIFGTKPAKLPPGQSIYGLAGDVRVNDQTATLSTTVKPGDTLKTGKNSEIIFVVNAHAMILRGESQLAIDAANASIGALVIGGLRLLSGKLLSVSRNSHMKVSTPTATIGIRGTGFYIESDPDVSYFCTCYGTTEVQANADPDSRESITASHHDRPVYIVKDGARGNSIRSAPFQNHSNQELALIETLVGRKTPFVLPNGAYSGPRQAY